MTISAALYNENETLLAAIEDNEWVSGDPFPWDIESDHQQLSVRRKSADISLEIDARSNPVRVRATLWRQGHCFVLDAGGVRMGASPMAGRILNLGLAGLALDFDTAQGSAKIIADPRFGAGAFVSEADADERLRKTAATWERIRRQKEHDIGRNGRCWCGSGLKLKRCHGA